jgi:DNA polymerase-3 subunit epsilon
MIAPWAVMAEQDIEALLEQLAAHPDLRVLRRLDVARECPPLTGPAVSLGVVLDTETTGMNLDADQVIELGLLKFEYDRESGAVGRVLEVYDGLEDPGRRIPPESTAIHHITDDMVRGQHLDEAAIARLLEGVGVVIAHNAGFDRPFVERRLPAFAALPWACSLREVPWDALGLGGAKLEFLAYRYGFFYEGHRAEIDCRALLEVLRRPVPEQAERANALRWLLASARSPSLRVWATGSPFETKDLLRARGYRWQSEKKVWYCDIPSSGREGELAWLKGTVYGGKSASIEVETFDARVRWSGRAGKLERLRL